MRSHPAVPLAAHAARSTEAVGVLLLLKAFASGCSALTGVEAIANAVPEFREPRAPGPAHRGRARRLLGAMLIGLAALIRKFDVDAGAAHHGAGPAHPGRAGQTACCSTWSS